MTFDELAAAGVVERDKLLGPLTTYKFGGPARLYAEAADEDTLRAVLEARRREGGESLPILVLGRGSNLVIADEGFDGLVLRLTGSFIGVDFAGGEGELVTAGGAVPLPRLARASVSRDRGGLEFFVGIPGSVGGAIRMNAGCHGSETADWLVTARVLNTALDTVTERSPTDLDLSYRHSNLVAGDVVLAATFRTVARNRVDGERRMREITQWRRDHQPGGTFNAGSVFKNPPSCPAGKLIDDLGLKGFSIGGAAVSDRHANFFVAADTASAQDVYDLVHEVRRIVAEATGVVLEPEIQFAGTFRPVRRSAGR